MQNLTLFSGKEIFSKCTVFADFQVNRPDICKNFAFMENSIPGI